MTRAKEKSNCILPNLFCSLMLCYISFHPTSAAAATKTCLRDGYDLKDIAQFSPWETIHDFSNATFTINVCDKLHNADGCPDGTSVCAKYPNGTSVNYGTFESDPITSTENPDGELMLVLKGQSCPDFDGEKYTSVFYFKCGKTLGHPYYLGDLGCTVHFEWESYMFCKDLTFPDKEVRCTALKDGHLIDLSPLIKLSGGYLLGQVDLRKIYINVCRDIKAETSGGTATCPHGAAVCQIPASGDGENFGEPTQSLEATSSGVRLTYEASEAVDGCSGKPKTVINFECPKRGGSKDPVLMTSFLCNNEILWVTEYACPVDHITSKTCRLTSALHDVDIDLSALKRVPMKENPYQANGTQGDDQYTYYINMCSGLGFDCGETHGDLTSVCQRKPGDDSFSANLGEMRHARLTYSDGELVMKYRNGDQCHQKLRRTTFINFHCNESAANNGIGYPVYEGESNCTYTFSWDTKLACVDRTMDSRCRVDADGKRFDLSALVKEHGGNWEVLVSANYDEESLYVNVCHDVLRNDKTSTCPPGAAMCSIGKDDGAKSFGKHTKGLHYDESSKSLKLVYTDGDKTDDGCARTTTINFFCHPGVLDSAPKLVHQSEDRCHYELEWHTAAACILAHKTGSNCQVYDDDAGYHFDLSPLTKKDGSYKVISPDGYTYYINVCDVIHGTTYCSEAPHNNSAICQVKTADPSQVMKIAEPRTLVKYFDGVLNLTYTNGEAYHNADHTNRMAEIAFLCDASKGVGSPTFLLEKDYTYAFEWRTSYACPVTPVECLATDPVTTKQYDLSRLSKAQENWEIVDDSDPNKKKKFYINVCQPLSTVQGDHCSPFGAVCATNIDKDGKETLFHANLGRAQTPPQLEKATGGLKLTYTNGNDCVDNGVTKKFTTSIHFVCVAGSVNGAPLAPKLIKPCEYSLIWETAEACAVDHIETDTDDKDKKVETADSCSIKDPNSDFTFNLMPLYKKDGEAYEVNSSDGKKTYKFNICGAVSEDKCGKFENSQPTSVCEDSTSVAAMTRELSYSSTGEMTLVYKGKVNQGTGQEKRYNLNFYCKREAQQPEIHFDREEVFNINFRIYTALACPPQPVECKAVDGTGQEYDLSPLAREDKNWEVIDPRPNHDNLRYHINVCRPVISTSEMSCPGGAVGGCQTGDTSYNMGYVQSKPVAASDGSAITIVYQGGDKCHVGKEQESLRSTRITFFCNAVEHSPEFEMESDTCEYRFVWRTPSACPQHKVVGSQCKVQEPLYDFEFDLSVLRKSKGNYKVHGDGYNFDLNVCGPLVTGSTPCLGQTVGACQSGTTLEHPIIAGVANDKLIYESGELSLVYSDGKSNCHGKYNRTTVIQFLCDHDTPGLSGPRYMGEGSDCTYLFEWPTSHACPPHEVIDCTYRHGNDVYDLSRLSLADSNWEKVYNTSNTAKTMYILNICRSLVPKKGQTCPFNSAACEIDLSASDEKKKYKNMGNVNKMSFSYDHNSLTLEYTNGDLCLDKTSHRSTKIIFDCDKNSDALGVPRSHFQADGCKDTFIWTSGVACPVVKKDDTDKSMQVGDCKTKNPQTGYEFDLGSLKSSRSYKTFDRAGHMYELNVCEAVENKENCPDGSGSCRFDIIDGGKATNAGKANGDLKYRDGVLVLEYKDGEACSKAGFKHTTFINFVCRQDAMKGKPVYVDKSGDCEYNFDWHTSLVCEKQIQCSVKTDSGKVLDFSPLLLLSGKYNVLSNVAEDNRASGMVYLNLCRPLNPVFGTLCPPGSGACLVRDGHKPLSLGRVHDSLTYNAGEKRAELAYTHGDPCPANPKVNISSLIIMKCHKGLGLDPELDSVTSDCQYVFVWLTPYACENMEETEFSSTCKYLDKNTGTTIDLSSLSDKYTVNGDIGEVYSLKPCGHLDEKGDKGKASCSDASVCVSGTKDKDGSLGRLDKATAVKTWYTLDVTYEDGQTCIDNGKSSKSRSTIMFKCDQTAGPGGPTTPSRMSDCLTMFTWETSLVCPEEREECTIGKGGAMYDLNFLSQDSGSWNYTDDKQNVYWLNLCQPVHGSTVRSLCPKDAAVCMKSSDKQVFMLGDVNTQKMTVEGQGDSASIVLQYSQGNTAACSSSKRVRREVQTSVSIRLKCSDTLGAPVLKKRVSNSEECNFEFEWDTRIACEIGKNPQKVAIKDGKIADARSGRKFDLNPFLQAAVHPGFSHGGKSYAVSLSGRIPFGSNNEEAKECQGAVVCQRSQSTLKYRNLGSIHHSAYFVKDDKVEVVFTSPHKCTGKHKDLNVTSTIIFDCVKGVTKKTDVELLYHTSDCGYVFLWHTDSVCFEATPSSSSSKDGKKTGNEDTAANPKSEDSGSSSASKIVIGVSVVVGIVVICLLILVLHRPERRASIRLKLRSCIPFGKKTESPFLYSKLSSSADADGELDDDPFNPFNAPDEEAEINNGQLPVQVHTFHDDSDEDMLL